MKQHTLAPWAEPVPDAPFPLTADDLLLLPDDGYTYELVEGRLVRMPGSGLEASTVALNLASALVAFVRAQKLGRVTGADGEYRLSADDAPYETALVPDVAYVRADRLPPRNSPQYRGAPHLAPDLVAEIASPNQYRPGMAAKSRLYLEHGVKLVWIVWPADQQVDVWRPESDEPAETLGIADSLDGLDVGVRVRISGRAFGRRCAKGASWQG